MQRVDADNYYFFNDDYFDRLRTVFGERLELILCLKGEELAAASLFLSAGGITQYHLSATAAPFWRQAPVKLLLAFAGARYHRLGQKLLHLGGGLGGSEDTLFRYKAGFSERRHAFRTWRWIVDKEAYRRLTDKVGQQGGRHFPAYRG